MPTAAVLIWVWFWELDGQRGHNGWGGLAITFAEIEAWSRLKGTRLEPWHLRALAEMDLARLAWTNRDKSNEADVVSERTMSTGLFDAMFG